MDIITAAEAKVKTLKQYFSGRPCKQGHIAPRWVSSHACTECSLQRIQKWRADPKNTKHRRKYRNEWSKANPDKVRRSRQKIQPRLTARKNEDRRTNVLKYLVYQAKRRAKAKGLPFDITPADLVMPTHCPIFGIRFEVGRGRQVDASATLDRIVPSKGYVKGNVQVISAKANRMKNDASLEELKALVEYLSQL